MVALVMSLEQDPVRFCVISEVYPSGALDYALLFLYAITESCTLIFLLFRNWRVCCG